MDDLKHDYREVKDEVKRRLRDLDGHDVADDVGNAGDEMRRELGDLGDDARRGAPRSQSDEEREPKKYPSPR